MLSKPGLKIVDLIHDITQLGYEVKFCQDFSGMIRLEFTEELDDSFYEHGHLGYPGCERLRLEKDIIESLDRFLEQHRKKYDNT
jgi:hypothetical protein